MEIKFCEVDGCKKPAVGTGKRPIKYCRGDYVKQCGPEFEAWKVTAQVAQAEDIDGIACAKTGEVISGGGTVWLDPAETNIPALVYAGHVEALPEPAPAKGKAPAGAEG